MRTKTKEDRSKQLFCIKDWCTAEGELVFRAGQYYPYKEDQKAAFSGNWPWHYPIVVQSENGDIRFPADEAKETFGTGTLRDFFYLAYNLGIIQPELDSYAFVTEHGSMLVPEWINLDDGLDHIIYETSHDIEYKSQGVRYPATPYSELHSMVQFVQDIRDGIPDIHPLTKGALESYLIGLEENAAKARFIRDDRNPEQVIHEFLVGSDYLEKPMTLDQILECSDENGYIRGKIAVNINAFGFSDSEENLDELSEKLTGTTMLLDIGFKVTGIRDDQTVILEVSGDASEVIRELEEDRDIEAER